MQSARLLAALVFGMQACALSAAAEARAQESSVVKAAPATPGAAARHTDSAAAGESRFDGLADAVLLAMRRDAEARKVGGVALVAYFEGEKVESWSSKMVVVGRVKDLPTGTGKGSNLLAIAYAKAAEMADTLKDSGSQVRPPMTGEFGWEGGVIVRMGTGYLIAAFSGGQSADDVAISRAGVAQVMAARTRGQ